MRCEHDWFNATKVTDTGPVEMCRLCGARSSDPAVVFERAWDYAQRDPAALDKLERGGLWRVYEQPPMTLRYEPEGPDATLEVRVINLRALWLRDNIFMIQARFESGGDWEQVTTGRLT